VSVHEAESEDLSPVMDTGPAAAAAAAAAAAEATPLPHNLEDVGLPLLVIPAGAGASSSVVSSTGSTGLPAVPGRDANISSAGSTAASHDMDVAVTPDSGGLGESH
jgi:hypothetical protein